MSTDPSAVATSSQSPVSVDGAVDIREHYQRIRPVLDALATVGDCPTMAVPDKHGWYVLGHNSDPGTCLNWQYRRRPRWLGRDLNSTIHSVDRTLYSLTSWKDPSLSDRWQLAQKQDGNWVYQNGKKPTPNAGDIRAISVWGDIDLADDVKQRRGSLSAQERSTIERALEEYAIEFSRIYGGRESIYMLDSVGGAYAFGPPEATLPIAL
jgi:hypothetical protein